MRLEGKTALVTGAGSGFGAGIAERFVAEGARVICADINAEAARRVAAGLGDDAEAVTADVAEADAWRDLAQLAEARFGRLDVLVNNAGYSHRNRPMLEVTEEEFDRVYAVNVKALYHSAQAFVPMMRKKGSGVILTVASTAGVRPRPGLTWYNGSKGAAIVLTKSMAAELAPDGIRVCALNPVMGETGMLETFMGVEDTPENRARFVASVPMGRLSRPADVANAALFLASDEAEFLTGVCMEVDGGRCV